MRRRTALAGCAALLALGVVPALASPSSPAGDPCSWSSFGHDAQHTFATGPGCSALTRSTAPLLAPAWFTPMRDSVTASPALADGLAFVGTWDGTFDALDLTTGAVRWTFWISSHARLAFGRIVSSALVTTVDGRDVVVFGGGSSIWMLDAHTGALVATRDLDPRTPELRAQQESSSSPPVVEVESSPALVTVDGQPRILVGLDVHDAAGVGRTGLVELALTPALDAVWKLDPETGQTHLGDAGLTVGSGEGFGCGGVWSSPAIAPDGTTAVFGTGSCDHPDEAYDAGQAYAEEMVAVDVRTGRELWHYRPADDLDGRAARIADANRDADFGASPNIFRLGSRLVVGEGRKSGDYVVRDLLTGGPVSITAAGPEGLVQDGFAVGGFLGTTAVYGGDGSGPRVIGATAIPVPHSAADLDKATWAIRGLDPASGTVSWVYRLAGPSYGHTSIANGVALVPDTTTSSLIVLNASTGLPLAVLPAVGPPSSTAAVSGAWVVLGTGTRETDLEYKAVNSQLQDDFQSTLGASPLSPLSGVQAWHLPLHP